MAATTISPLFCTLTLPIWFLLGQLLLCPYQVTAQWPPNGGGFWSPSNNNFFNNLNRGILPGGVKLSDLGGFPGAKAGSVTPQGAGRSNDIDCGIEPDAGPCNNKKTMFFYDQQSGRCFTFEYGGCMGNPNKYRTEKECLARCKPPRRKAAESNQDPCRLPADKGPCRRDLERFFYNANTGRCEVFIYGGCGGNKNHFRDMASCNDACQGGGQQGQGQPQGRQDQGPENRGPQGQGPQGQGPQGQGPQGQGPQGQGPQDQGPQDQGPQDQGPQDQGPQDQGPQGQGPQGQGPDLCELPPAPGNCRQRLLRYYFDARSGTCRDFIYSGCEGNDNSFEDERGCNERCGRDAGRPDNRDNRGPEQEQPSGNNVCTLPPVRGRCRDNVIRFYYDVRAGICRDFSYSGCDGNNNNFERLADCERECRPEPPQTQGPPPRGEGQNDNICLQPPETGRCRSRIVRYYFDSRLERCTDFVYSGCDANDNNFESLETCERRCMPAPAPDRRPVDRPDDRRPVDRPDDRRPVDRPDDRRPVDRRDDRRPVDRPDDRRPVDRPDDRRPVDRPDDRRPVNRPEDRRPVDRRDDRRPVDRSDDRRPVDRPDDRRPVDRPDARRPVDRPDDRRPVDRPDDRRPNDRNKQPIPVNICILRPDEGPCTERQGRLYYDANVGECRNFVYGGCQGNENNFQNLQACEDRCKPAPSPKTPNIVQTPYPPGSTIGGDICTLAPVTGGCQGKIARFFFDPQSGQCKIFSYGGCDGNPNNFETNEACMARCKPAQPRVTATPVPDLCFLPPVVGGCRMRLPRVYYDPRAGACRSFTFSGCRGNDNNFNDVATCETRCKPAPMPTTVAPPVEEVCSLPSMTGPCRARFPRYYYTNGECRQFTYGGCGGNGNNFKDIKDCEAKCKIIPDNQQKDCGSPSDAGRCLGFFRRFFFNRQTRKCETFVYGGCQGNSNNYKTQKECEKACQPPEEPKPREERLIQCPAPNGIAACVDMCRTNSNCGEGQKCCSNGCGRLCIRDGAKKAP